MAKKDQYSQAMAQESEKTGATEISLPSDAKHQAVTKRETGRKIEPKKATKKLASVQGKAKYTTTVNAVALKASKPNTSNAASRTKKSLSLHTKENSEDNSNSVGRNNNPHKKNMFSIVPLSVSGFLVLFVLFFCILPLKQVSYEVPIVYQEIETYTEQEPYVETVNYSEQEPYTITEPYVVSQSYTVTEPYIVYQQSPISSQPQRRIIIHPRITGQVHIHLFHHCQHHKHSQQFTIATLQSTWM